MSRCSQVDLHLQGSRAAAAWWEEFCHAELQQPLLSTRQSVLLVQESKRGSREQRHPCVYTPERHCVFRHARLLLLQGQKRDGWEVIRLCAALCGRWGAFFFCKAEWHLAAFLVLWTFHFLPQCLVSLSQALTVSSLCSTGTFIKALKYCLLVLFILILIVILIVTYRWMMKTLRNVSC